jgi:two-component system nitrogen regulation response regulator NtrX
LREGIALAEEFTGNSVVINQVRATLKRVANTGSRVLISGPAGSGKEVAARLLHAWSPRADKAFVTVNSARITPSASSRKLFGEEAEGKLLRAGLLEMADGGTLYLDEIADMPLNTQARILRVLTEQKFVRVGGNRQLGVDVRVVSSTARDLEIELAEKRFREDLFYRLNVVPVTVPSLAERRDDVPALADHFFTRYAREQGLPAPEIAPEAMAALQAYDWPGNVRQLRNVVERTVILAPRERMARIEPRHAAVGDYWRGFGQRGRHLDADGGAASRGPRELRARVPAHPDTPVSRQHLEDRGFIGMERSALHRKLKLLGMSDREEAIDKE